ncbi:pyridoxal phosphate-dependent aminotransferase [Fluoribacter gormanii]|uniref:Aminotransferase n=1 Tax=Fluoribacter gormanii TaxID=464 RepID=A0A377GF80_9GAMM|nr:pyridoxal phosphate-dependent aminotransferase [Fluoribacter gormanii]KTD00455.1 aspartate aminotransferase A [Fluoribacter gormanii]MCW8445186.1 pyridoxal phosphate-dependent aminotransferase [Fluoribacter gormanii]MCW8470395.1 pyridoxal phosphate-dependent aminotransferase [Fluoribacter gormanii]SIR10304.1 aspartate aminotransferase/aminotransferase [Fluoribacter gormanii]STO23243.1 Putative aminotransferase A [Fluoribacter gormanii]
MLTPDGHCANKIEKVMLLALWANTLRDEIQAQGLSETKKLIFAGLGKPTYPINSHTIASYLAYWQKLDDLTNKWKVDPHLVEEDIAIDYGDPRGDYAPRELMADIMSRWYGTEVRAHNVLFTVGGIGALRVLFETFNTHYEDVPGYRIITPFPYYSAYSNNPSHCLHPIHVMDEPGYKLTARATEQSIKEAYSLAEMDHGWPKAILICNPSNPLGNIIDEDELRKIADVLRQYPDLYIIFDEAYTEMSFSDMPSFLKIAPDLKERVIVLRSATKALSAAGERMAVLLVFESSLMNEMLNKNISYFIHAPRSAQAAYAQTMANFGTEEKNNIAAFYKKKVDYVVARLKAMGAAMPDPLYQVEATFYVLADFSDMFGLPLPNDAARVLQRSGLVKTDEELAYYLLFEDNLMITPLSYFGLSKQDGFMRITCSGRENELQDLMDRLERRLFQSRKNKRDFLLEQINHMLPELAKIDTHLFDLICQKLQAGNAEEDTCLNLKSKNQVIAKIYDTIVDFFEMMKQEA